ncbi:MAG: hypothetical protein RIC14_16770 [Filomicrobium sp.]
MRAIVFAAATAVAISLSAPASAADLHNVVLKPGKGQSFKVGANTAVGYFLEKGGKCAVTLMVAPAGEIDTVKGAGSRVRFDVEPGATGAFEAAEGEALQLTCAADAKTLAIKPFQRVAQFQPTR